MGRFVAIPGGFNLRSVVAIIGSAGQLEDSIRQKVELLARELSKHNFDLVTGGRDGVMRAVARGHHLGRANNSNLIHIDPGWDGAETTNPYPAATVRTNLGSMRNHLVVRSSDIVVAVGGGAGTLSEISIAWQEKKPIFSLEVTDGWATTLSKKSLDHRRDDVIVGCNSVDEVVTNLRKLRPSGVFGGRCNRGFFPDVVPAIHRIHCGDVDNVHEIHHRFGMTIEKSVLIEKLSELNVQIAKNRSDTVGLVTFDDGWSDVMCLIDAFQEFEHLQPVLFLGENHFGKTIKPLPLQRWYQHCSTQDADIEPIRTYLKSVDEIAAHLHLDSLNVDRMFNPDWLLSHEQISILRSNGWLVGSHGHQHEDLTKRKNLGQEFDIVTNSIEQRNGLPWLCWPEGKWDYKSHEEAVHSGFVLQFGLGEEEHPQPLPSGLVLRTIWR